MARVYCAAVLGTAISASCVLIGVYGVGVVLRGMNVSGIERCVRLGDGELSLIEDDVGCSGHFMVVRDPGLAFSRWPSMVARIIDEGDLKKCREIQFGGLTGVWVGMTGPAIYGYRAVDHERMSIVAERGVVDVRGRLWPGRVFWPVVAADMVLCVVGVVAIRSGWVGIRKAVRRRRGKCTRPN